MLGNNESTLNIYFVVSGLAEKESGFIPQKTAMIF